MPRPQIAAVAALAALSLVVACSGNNGGVVPPSPQGALAPDGALAKSKIRFSPKALQFSATGAANVRSFKATEAGYKGAFAITSTCGKNVSLSPAKRVKGPAAEVKVTPLADVSCKVTLQDADKNEGSIDVTVKAATPTPSPSGSPTASPTPGTAAIVNGNFASGALAPGWKACSFAHNGYPAPVNASPAPAGTGAQPTASTAPISAGNLAAYGNSVGTPPPNLNPNDAGAIPAELAGGKVAMTGDENSQNAGAAGICQTFTVPASQPYLSFWAYEGGSEYNFGYADQEADVLDSTGSTIQKTLFAEDNCYWDPGKVGQTGYTNDGCIPASQGGTSSYVDWQGGYWVERGPYDLSAFAGQSVTLFLGVWCDSTHNAPYPDTYSQEMFVGDVQMSSSSTFPTSFPTSRKRR